VGGFPCQDYSVTRNLSASGGLEGKKGVLWWSIYNVLKTKGKKAPKYIMLENVDRLLTSPASRRGRDFAIILSSLNELGYVVEWRVINAADYGMPQRRKRIFILAYKKGSNIQKQFNIVNNPVEWFAKAGAIQQSFPADVITDVKEFTIDKDPAVVSETFNLEKPKVSPFANAGVCADYKVHTARVTPKYTGVHTTLADILIPEKEVPEEFFISKDDFERWQYLKGSKDEPRKAASGFKFTYKEGAVAFPEPLDKASRTIITSEGGPTPSRFKHVVKVGTKYRRLTPLELERLCMFPDHHTQGHGDVKRAFFMGNALVVGVIDGLGKALVKVDEL
jgi:DNA (cytosine-5)-methyltransferase 1